MEPPGQTLVDGSWTLAGQTLVDWAWNPQVKLSRLGMEPPGEATGDTDTRQHREQKKSRRIAALPRRVGTRAAGGGEVKTGEVEL